MKHFNNIFKIIIFLNSINPIFTRIITEVTDHGVTLLRGTPDELQDVRKTISKLLDNVDDKDKKRKKRGVDQGFGNLSLKELITHQIAMKIDSEFALSFNTEIGPQRGEYRALEVDESLVRTGLKKDAEEYGILHLPKSHYCRYRQTTERVDANGIKDLTPCCKGENKQCYTDAGCFCDESCYTKYGDCCTDHFVKCYQFLKLCLISVDDSAAAQQKETDEDQYNQSNQHKISGQDRDKYAQMNGLEELLTMRAFGGTFQHRPTQLTPDQCCGQKPYNSGDEDEKQRNPLCCDQNLHWVHAGTTCDSFPNA
jgi:hypothetical protein